MVTKELEGQKNAKMNKKSDDKIIRLRVTLLVKNDVTNPSDRTDNSLTSSATSDITQVSTSNPALKSAQVPGNKDYLARLILSWRKGRHSVFRIQEVLRKITHVK